MKWIRSTCSEEPDSFDPDIPPERYPLIDQKDFQKDYKEYVAYGYLNTICYLAEDIVFIDDIIFFSCTGFKVIRAVCNPDIESTIKRIF